jgi:hypothetical protein
MFNKVSAIAIGVVALSAVLGSTAVQAQESCSSMYNRMMGIYQSDPYSPTYAQMVPYYNSHCAQGAYQSPQPQAYANPAYAPAYSQYQQPAPYGYAPAPVDPAAAVLGAAIIGGAIAADGDYRGRDDWGYRGGGGWRR